MMITSILRNLTTLGCVVAMASIGTPARAASKGLVAFSQAEMTNEWRVMDTKEMEKAWKDAGYDFTWTDAKSDPSKQLADVEDLLARKPVVLIVAPIEYEPLAPVPALAEKAHVPLLVVDRSLPGKPGQNGWISLVTTDFVDSGKRVADDVVSQLTKKNGSPKGTILHVTGNTGASPVIDEEKGLEEIFRTHPDIKVAASCDSKNSRAGGRKCMEDLLQSFPAGSIDGVVFDNDDAAIGGIAAIKAAGRDELKGMLWAKDGTVDGLQAVLNGDLSFTVQTPPFFGASSVKAFQDFEAGKKVEPVVYVNKESFDAHTPQHRERVEQRIQELKKMGVGCC